MAADPYLQRRSEIETYFDRTAAEAWALDVAYCSGLRAALTAHGPLTP